MNKAIIFITLIFLSGCSNWGTFNVDLSISNKSSNTVNNLSVLLFDNRQGVIYKKIGPFSLAQGDQSNFLLLLSNYAMLMTANSDYWTVSFDKSNMACNGQYVDSVINSTIKVNVEMKTSNQNLIFLTDGKKTLGDCSFIK